MLQVRPESLTPETSTARAPARNLNVTLAQSADEIREAQMLRWRVFGDEMGARLDNRTPGVDRDHFDPYCQHLIVRDENAGKIVGTYRILTPDAARRIGEYYSESEFDITRLQHLRSNLVEVGRSCIDAEYRTGAVISLLWGGLLRFMHTNGFEYLMGCASITMADGGHNAANVCHLLQQDFLAAPEYHAFPRHALPVDALRTAAAPEIPALLKGYMRVGAKVCGNPAWDPDFNTADLLLLVGVSNIDARYARHFKTK